LFSSTIIFSLLFSFFNF